ncbi:MAG: acyl-CoA synthetase [Gammaproteobacteria bacterium]|nr:acyl-CoA synthetase [Gammaproteobacteria bacterium]MBU1480985.1 acyl-CoA synthetase [Gammaproteobacteria bacterium]
MSEEIGDKAAPDWAAKPERSNTLAIRFIVWVALTLGRRAARLFLYPICLYFLLFAGEARAASKKYLRKVLGREPHIPDGFRHIHTFASTILDRVFLLNGRFDKFDVRAHLDDTARTLIGSRRGCILLGAHLGSFEITRAYADEIEGPQASVVMYEENARKLNSVLKAINPDLTQQVIALGKVDSMLKVEQALQRGEFIGILADRGLESGGASVTCDFLGEPAKFPSGPLRMAYMLKSPVLLMAGVYRGGNRYDLYFEELMDMSKGELPRNEMIRQAQQRYVERIEYHCRNAPYNWFNFYDFWKP